MNDFIVEKNVITELRVVSDTTIALSRKQIKSSGGLLFQECFPDGLCEWNVMDKLSHEVDRSL